MTKTKLCSECGKRPAKFKYRGVVKSDNDHDMCLQCFRSAVEQGREGKPENFHVARRG